MQVTLPEEIEGEAHAAIKTAADGMDQKHIDALAMRLLGIQQEADKDHRWRLPVTMTHKDVARVMLATQDVLEGMALNTDTETLRWLCDSCTDTDLVSHDFATREKLDIDTTVRIRIGTAGGASFLTNGMATVKLPIIDIKGSKHILKIRAHVADIGKKCLVNTVGLAQQGYIFVHGGDNKGTDGTFMMSPSKAVFALSQDECGMLILPTKGAPIKTSSAPAGLMAQVARMMREGRTGGHANMAHGNDTGSDVDMPELKETSSDESEGYDSDEWATEDESELYDEIAKFVYEAEARKPRARTQCVVHTPQSWHTLLHTGCKLTWATAKSSDALFDVGGKVKVGHDLTSEDHKEFDKAAASCCVCQQTKLTALAAQGSQHHVSAKRWGD